MAITATAAVAAVGATAAVTAGIAAVAPSTRSSTRRSSSDGNDDDKAPTEQTKKKKNNQKKPRVMVEKLTLGRHASNSNVGIGFVKPSISWRFRDVVDVDQDHEQDVTGSSNKAKKADDGGGGGGGDGGNGGGGSGRGGWVQSTYELRFTRRTGTGTGTGPGAGAGADDNASSKVIQGNSDQDHRGSVEQQQTPTTTSSTGNNIVSSYIVTSSSNVHVPWPAEEPGLRSRERVRIAVRVKGGSERSGERPLLAKERDAGDDEDVRGGDEEDAGRGGGGASSSSERNEPTAAAKTIKKSDRRSQDDTKEDVDGEWSEWFEETFEAALTLRGDENDRANAQDEQSIASDWHGARFISTQTSQPKDALIRPFYARTTFELSQEELDELRRRDEAEECGGAGIRCYATALGCYTLQINGQRLTTDTPSSSDSPRLDVLAPGWQAYQHRLHYQTHVVPASYLRAGANTILACVGEGWYAGRLLFNGGKSRLYGEQIGVMVALFVGGEQLVVVSDDRWETAQGPLVSSEIYDGEVYDARVSQDPSTWEWSAARALPDLPKEVALIAPESPPIREIEKINVKDVSKSPSGKTILDFGQNLVGYLRLTIPSKPSGRLVIRHAEVLEKSGELGVRPLRAAKATDTIILGSAQGGAKWTPTFTFHGFRYADIELLDDDGKAIEFDLAALDVHAVVIHSDMERLGHFTSSHEMVDQLHSNVVWGLRGNFVGIPSDCPQRDERLGWTGDIQVFAPTASYLYDTSAFLGDWLHDLREEQLKDSGGVPNVVIPDVLRLMWPQVLPQAIWGDVAALLPRDLWKAYGDKRVLEDQWESMSAWLDKGVVRNSETGLWQASEKWPQLGDWLDPQAPPDDPGAALTDPQLCADAYLVHVTGVVAELAGVIGRSDDAERYAKDHERLRRAFQAEYTTSNGRLVSDTQTALCLALHFNLLEEGQRQHAINRLVYLVRKKWFTISTGFAGTPIILRVLAANGQLQVAYRMLQEKQCPSWLYPVSMGATTVWERWDSMLPSGEINPGEMTSFNHYALGSVAAFMHETIGGLSSLEPGYRRIRIAPRPGGTFRHASTSHVSPYGLVSCKWEVKDDGKLSVKAVVPFNTTAQVELPGKDGFKGDVGSGMYEWTVEAGWKEEAGEWPPKGIQPFMAPPRDEMEFAR